MLCRFFTDPDESFGARRSNGISFAGQMLIPIYLIRACGQSPSATGWLLAPLGVGMICSYPWMGALTQRLSPGQK
jgi:predicted MFS family arabinose efflux permease